MEQVWEEADATIKDIAGSVLLLGRTDRLDRVQPETTRKLQSGRAGDESGEIHT